ncbi:MAG: hypothetical protein ACFCU5_02025 [Pleurocapsa sp.]
MTSAVQKSYKVKEALESFDSESEFWAWYNREIKEEVSLENDLKTFGECIAVVEDDFWSRPDRRKRKRDKSNPSDLSSWYDTYERFYKHLPHETIINLKDILTVINRQNKGTKTYKGVVSAMKRLARMNHQKTILDELDNLDVTQVEYRKLQAITLDEFLEWRDRVLGITTELHPNANLDVRKAWLWVFSMQVGIPLEVRAQSMGHTPAMNDSTYKKRKRTQTTIDLLLNSNTQAIDFVHALNEAKQLCKDNPDSKVIIAELIARIYGKNTADIVKLLI